MTKVRELRAEEFLRRFLLHVVPSGFVRIRHYGLLANRTRQEKLARCRQLLVVTAVTALTSPETPTADSTPVSLARCPACGNGSLRVISILAPSRGRPP